MVNRIGTVYPCSSKKGFSSRFFVDSRVWQETPEEGQRMNRLKCDYNNKDEFNSINILSNDNDTNNFQTIIWFHIRLEDHSDHSSVEIG